jgi:predicted ester cyclase
MLLVSEYAEKGAHHMSTEENKALIRRLVAEGWNQGNLATLDEIIAPNFVDHSPMVPNLSPGSEGYKQFVVASRTACPDFWVTIEDLIAEGDTVVMRITAGGTHQGVWLGIPPTGKQFTETGIYIFRMAIGKVVERWGNQDDVGMMQQLGLIPAPGQAS